MRGLISAWAAKHTAKAPDCTCHPSDHPPIPCPHKNAFSECAAQYVTQNWVSIPLELRRRWQEETDYGTKSAELSHDTWLAIRAIVGARR